jgi:DNA-binding IclR family transcriptional regulator
MVREQGYATDCEESTVGAHAIAVPITDTERMKGALFVAGPAKRMDTDRLEGDILEALEQTANLVEIKVRQR